MIDRMTQRGLLLTLLFTAACGGGLGADTPTFLEGEEPSVPDDFEKVETPCPFHFYAPPTIKGLSVQGIDSCVARYTLNDCELNADYGAFSDRLDGHESELDYEGNEPTVDGRPAKLIRFRSEADQYFIGLHLPIFEDDPWSISLTLSASCASVESRDELSAVLLSVVVDE